MQATAPLLSLVRRVLFLGGPLHLSSVGFERFLHEVQAVLRTDSPSKLSIDHCMSISSRFLNHISRSENLIPKKAVACWYESLRTHGSTVLLDRESAIIDGCEELRIRADHVGLSSISGPFDMSFQTLCREINAVRHGFQPELPSQLEPQAGTDFINSEENLVYESTCSEDTKRRLFTVLSFDKEGRYAAAKDACLNAMEVLGSNGMQSSLIFACFTGKLAEILQRLEDYSAAEDQCRNLLRSTPCDQQQRPEIISLQLRLASILLDRRRSPAAIQVLRSAFSSTVIDDLDTINLVKLLTIWASLCEMQGRFWIAEIYYRNALRTCWSCIGPDDVSTAMVRLKLARLLSKQRRWRIAHALTEQAFEGIRKHFGFEHPESLSCMSFLGLTCVFATTVEQGKEFLVEACHLQRQLLGDDHPDTRWSAGALKLLESAHSDDESVEGTDPPGQFEIGNNLGGGGSQTPGTDPPGDGQDERVDSGFEETLRSYSKTGLDASSLRVSCLGNRADDLTGLYGSPLHIESFHGHVTSVSTLLDSGADIDVCSGIFRTPLHAAVLGGHESVVRLLLERGAKPEPEGTNCHPLEIAVTMQRTDLAKVLLNQGANPNIRDPLFGSVLSYALITAQNQTIQLLVSSDAKQKFHADPNYGSSLFGSPLETAVWIGDVAQAKTLLEHGAHFDLSREAWSAFHLARTQAAEMTKLFVDKAKALYDVDISDATLRIGNADILQEPIQYPSDILGEQGTDAGSKGDSVASVPKKSALKDGGREERPDSTRSRALATVGFADRIDHAPGASRPHSPYPSRFGSAASTLVTSQNDDQIALAGEAPKPNFKQSPPTTWEASTSRSSTGSSLSSLKNDIRNGSKQIKAFFSPPFWIKAERAKKTPNPKKERRPMTVKPKEKWKR